MSVHMNSFLTVKYIYSPISSFPDYRVSLVKKLKRKVFQGIIFSQSIGQTVSLIGQSISQLVNQSDSQSVVHSGSQFLNQSVSQSVSQSISQTVSKSDR